MEGHLSANNCKQLLSDSLAKVYRGAPPICSVSIIQTIGDSTQLVPLLYKSKAVDHDVILPLHCCPVTTTSSLWMVTFTYLKHILHM